MARRTRGSRTAQLVQDAAASSNTRGSPQADNTSSCNSSSMILIP